MTSKFLRTTIFIIFATVVLINARDIYKLKQQNIALYKIVRYQDEIISNESERLWNEKNKIQK